MADPPRVTESPGTQPPDPAAAHRSSLRRLLFGIELTLVGLVLVVAIPNNPQAGILVAVFGLLFGLSGL